LLSRGAEADVPAGSEVAMQLVRPVIVNVDQGLRQSTANDRSLYTAAAMVRGAQTALRLRKYYDGASTGRLDDATRRSIAHYQIDNNEPATGDLDQATAASRTRRTTAASTHSVASATSRQLAADISRRQPLLLNSCETRFGVRIADIRSKPQLPEQDLDLLASS
jgi:hypothetical protein